MLEAKLCVLSLERFQFILIHDSHPATDTLRVQDVEDSSQRAVEFVGWKAKKSSKVNCAIFLESVLNSTEFTSTSCFFFLLSVMLLWTEFTIFIL